MENINIVVEYLKKIKWETVYDSFKPEFKRMWVTLNNPLRDLHARYNKLVKLRIVANNIEAK